jgi:hypothetical protein
MTFWKNTLSVFLAALAVSRTAKTKSSPGLQAHLGRGEAAVLDALFSTDGRPLSFGQIAREALLTSRCAAESIDELLKRDFLGHSHNALHGDMYWLSARGRTYVREQIGTLPADL